MRPLLAAALFGLATYGAYALLVHPQTAALMHQLATAPPDDDDLARASASHTERAQQTAASSGARPLRAAGGVGGDQTQGSVNTNVGQVTYPVHGASERAVLESLRAGGPSSAGSRFFGLTVTELEYRYYKVSEHGACRIEDVVVDLNVEITLPDWTPSAGADSELRSAWARFSTALRGHENGHRDLAVQGAEAVRDALEGLRTRDCDTADAEAQRAAERVRVETEAAHRDFDHRTEHGRTQGAVWPQP